MSGYRLFITVCLGFGALFLSILGVQTIWQGSPPPPTEEVCIKLYLLGGHVKTACYDLPKGEDIYMSDGNRLVRRAPGVFGDMHIMKRYVVDFEIISRK